VASLSSNRWACQRKHRHALSERCRDALASTGRAASFDGRERFSHAVERLTCGREYWRMREGGYNVPARAELLEVMQSGGVKAFLEAHDGAFHPEPFGPRSGPAKP